MIFAAGAQRTAPALRLHHGRFSEATAEGFRVDTRYKPALFYGIALVGPLDLVGHCKMSRLTKSVLLGFLIGLAGVALSFFHFAHDFEENAGLGLLFSLRGLRKAPADVVVVSIDSESSEQLDVPRNPDRWPRSLHARLVE
ncbi:MAG: hypothetical protein ACREQP_19920, partial [Candidatus Binatia bacterium]